jgi:protein involved in polysaccharide export with SLBB domain
VPVLKDVKAAGKTFPQLDAELTDGLSKRLVNPEVTVSAVALRDAMVYVIGEVVAPKPVPLNQAQTAMQALTWAGGFKPSAEKSAVALIRLTPEGHLRAYKIPVKIEGQPGPFLALAAIPLQADDILLVPQSGIAQFDQIVSEWVNQPLQGVNSFIAPIANYYLIRALN